MRTSSLVSCSTSFRFFSLVASFICLGVVAQADTIAHWDFDSLISGVPTAGGIVPHTAGTPVFEAAIPDLSGNGNHLSAYNNNGGDSTIRFSEFVAPDNGSNSEFSVESNTAANPTPSLYTQGDLDLGGSPIGQLTSFTIEASVYFKSFNFFDTFLGVDGVGSGGSGSFIDDGVVGGTNDPNAANLYFQRKGLEDNAFRFNFTANDGNTYLVDSVTIPEINQWYHVAVTNDGQNLKLYINRELEREMDMQALSGGSSPIGLFGINESGTSATDAAPYAWTLFRGMYLNGHGDRVNGFIDDVRISNVALEPNDFLNPGISPLTIYVNTSSGNITIQNDGDNPIAFDYYIIHSDAGSLDPTQGSGWNSLSDQNIDPAFRDADFDTSGAVDGVDLSQWEGDYGDNGDSDADGDGDSDGNDFLVWQKQLGETSGGPGDTWNEAAGASANNLAELFLNGQSTLDPGQTISLGKAFNVGGAQDLRFDIGIPGVPDLTQATVVYVNSSIASVPEPTTFGLCICTWLLAAGLRRSR